MLIYCDAGHGLHTAGKRTPDGEKEWTFNNEVVKSFVNELKKYKDVTIYRTDDKTGERDVPLRERTNKANKAGADFYISFHHNSFQSKWGNHTGVETYYNKNSTVGKKIAEKVQKALVEAYGLRDRGIKTANLHITRETNMPAILVEGGFMDSQIDIKKLRDKKVLQKAGKMIAKAIATYFNLKKSTDKQKDNESLVVDGYLGPKTISALQRYFGTPVDGYLSKPSLVIKALQKFLGTPVDGYISKPYSLMVAALQKRFGTPVDGYISSPSLVIKELQRRLNKGKI